MADHRLEPTRRDPRARWTRLWRSPRLAVALLVLCLVLAALVGLAWWRPEQPSTATAAGTADGGSPPGITSESARRSGQEAAARLTGVVLSYGWKTLDRDVERAQLVSAPSFRAQYNRTMAGVRKATLDDQVTLTATPVETAVVSASEAKVVALVFVDQATTAKGSLNRRVDQLRVLVTLTRHGGEWRVSKMDAI